MCPQSSNVWFLKYCNLEQKFANDKTGTSFRVISRWVHRTLATRFNCSEIRKCNQLFIKMAICQLILFDFKPCYAPLLNINTSARTHAINRIWPKKTKSPLLHTARFQHDNFLFQIKLKKTQSNKHKLICV